MLFTFKFTSPSVTYQLSTCRKWYVASCQPFHDHFIHETYKHHTSTVTWSESKLKNPPGQNDYSRQKQTSRWKDFFVSIIILGHEYTGSASPVIVELLTILQKIGKNRRMAHANSRAVIFSFQKQACLAIRNLVGRNPEHREIILELGAEALIRKAQQFEGRADLADLAKGALRDLGCSVELKELWTGTGQANMARWNQIPTTSQPCWNEVYLNKKYEHLLKAAWM